MARRKIVIFIIFSALGIILYSNTFQAPFIFDDTYNITDNPHIRLKSLSFKEIADAGFKGRLSTRPLAKISFALNYYFHQYDLFGFHLVNIIIHILTGFFLFLFLSKTLETALASSQKNLCSQDTANRPSAPELILMVSFFSALIWLVHPVQIQSVTYIVQRMNSMAAMFYILSMLLYVYGRRCQRERRPEQTRQAGHAWPWFAGSVAAGLMALASKEISLTLPFFIFLYEWYLLIVLLFLFPLQRALGTHPITALVHRIGAIPLQGRFYSR